MRETIHAAGAQDRTNDDHRTLTGSAGALAVVTAALAAVAAPVVALFAAIAVAATVTARYVYHAAPDEGVDDRNDPRERRHSAALAD